MLVQMRRINEQNVHRLPGEILELGRESNVVRAEKLSVFNEIVGVSYDIHPDNSRTQLLVDKREDACRVPGMTNTQLDDQSRFLCQGLQVELVVMVGEVAVSFLHLFHCIDVHGPILVCRICIVISSSIIDQYLDEYLKDDQVL